jgi:hypothetical protein
MAMSKITMGKDGLLNPIDGLLNGGTKPKTDIATSTQLLVELECSRQSLLKTINSTFDHMIMLVENNFNLSKATNGNGVAEDKPEHPTVINGHILPITTPPAIFNAKKPVAVIIDGRHILVKSWREVLSNILEHCCQDQVYHQRLVELQNEVAGKFRVFLSDKPDGMTKPVKIVEGMYVEVHHGAKAMIHALINKLLIPIGYDCSKIQVGILQ